MQAKTSPRKWFIVCLYAAGIAIGLALLVQHWVHIPVFLPYVVFLACPLMHIFMHKGHGRHGHASGAEQTSASPDWPRS